MRLSLPVAGRPPEDLLAEMRAMKSGDATSRERLGHGNAIASTYNHVILPLASTHERKREIFWGMHDFRARFGRESQGFWCPETALDDVTVESGAMRFMPGAHRDPMTPSIDFLNAENFYTKGVESNSEHPRSLIGVARARIARGIKLKDASESLTEILARPAELLSPKLRSNALTAVAELRLFEKKFDEAQKSADEAIAAYANNPWAHFVKGRALAGAKNTAAAASIEKAIEMDKFVPEFYYLGSAALIEGGDSAKAQALLDAYAKVLKPDDRYYIAYGELLAKLGKPDEALAQFNKAIEANNFNANAHYAKGALLLESKKDYEGAQKELEAALGANEIFPDAHARLGDLRFAKKEYQEGCEQYAQGLAKMKILQVPRERLNDLREGVEKKLVAANKKDMAKMWMTETGALIR